MRKRIITGGILSAFFLLIFFLAKTTCFGKWLLLGVTILINGFCAYEFSRLCYQEIRFTLKGLIYFLLTFFPSIFALLTLWDVSLCALDGELLYTHSTRITQLSLLGFFPALFYAFYRGKESLEAASNVVSELLMGMALIAVGSASLISLCLLPYSHYLLLWLVVLVAVSDSAAYFLGTRYKSAKIAPAISPGKSVIGTAAGIVCGSLAGLLFAFLLSLANYGFSTLEVLLLSIVAIIFAQTGDLAKSFIKRLHGKKDSGTILPGHGGILDRVDGLLAAAVVLNFFILNY